MSDTQQFADALRDKVRRAFMLTHAAKQIVGDERALAEATRFQLELAEWLQGVAGKYTNRAVLVGMDGMLTDLAGAMFQQVEQSVIDKTVERMLADGPKN